MINFIKKYAIYFAITLVAFLIRIWNIGNVKTFSMDEGYYINDALSISKYGYEVEWINHGSSVLDEAQTKIVVDSLLSGEGFKAYSSEYSAMHPPLGKELIALGLNLFGSDSIIGWRFSAVIAGTLLVALSMILAYLLFKNNFVTAITGLLMATDPMAIAMSRVSLLDIFLSVFVIVGVIFSLLHLRNIIDDKIHRYKYFYLILAAVSFGLASSIKWSGLYFFAAFMILTLIVQVIFERKNKEISYFKILLAYVCASIIFAVSYVVTWSSWFINYASKSNGIFEQFSLFVAEHSKLLNFHTGLSSLHNYNSKALEWLIVARPTFLYSEPLGSDGIVFINSSPNILFWLSGIMACIAFTVFIVKGRSANRWTYLVPLVAVTAGWLPWVLSSGRTVFQYYTIVFEPYIFVILAFMIVHFVNSLNKSYKLNFLRTPFILFIAAGLAFSVFMYSGAVGMPVKTYNSSYTFAAYWQNAMKNSGLYDDSQMPH